METDNKVGTNVISPQQETDLQKRIVEFEGTPEKELNPKQRLLEALRPSEEVAKKMLMVIESAALNASEDKPEYAEAIEIGKNIFLWELMINDTGKALPEGLIFDPSTKWDHAVSPYWARNDDMICFEASIYNFDRYKYVMNTFKRQGVFDEVGALQTEYRKEHREEIATAIEDIVNQSSLTDYLDAFGVTAETEQEPRDLLPHEELIQRTTLESKFATKWSGLLLGQPVDEAVKNYQRVLMSYKAEVTDPLKAATGGDPASNPDLQKELIHQFDKKWGKITGGPPPLGSLVAPNDTLRTAYQIEVTNQLPQQDVPEDKANETKAQLEARFADKWQAELSIISPVQGKARYAFALLPEVYKQEVTRPLALATIDKNPTPKSDNQQDIAREQFREFISNTYIKDESTPSASIIVQDGKFATRTVVDGEVTIDTKEPDSWQRFALDEILPLTKGLHWKDGYLPSHAFKAIGAQLYDPKDTRSFDEIIKTGIHNFAQEQADIIITEGLLFDAATPKSERLAWLTDAVSPVCEKDTVISYWHGIQHWETKAELTQREATSKLLSEIKSFNGDLKGLAKFLESSDLLKKIQNDPLRLELAKDLLGAMQQDDLTRDKLKQTIHAFDEKHAGELSVWLQYTIADLDGLLVPRAKRKSQDYLHLSSAKEFERDDRVALAEVLFAEKGVFKEANMRLIFDRKRDESIPSIDDIDIDQVDVLLAFSDYAKRFGITTGDPEIAGMILVGRDDERREYAFKLDPESTIYQPVLDEIPHEKRHEVATMCKDVGLDALSEEIANQDSLTIEGLRLLVREYCQYWIPKDEGKPSFPVNSFYDLATNGLIDEKGLIRGACDTFEFAMRSMIEVIDPDGNPELASGHTLSNQAKLSVMTHAQTFYKGRLIDVEPALQNIAAEFEEYVPAPHKAPPREPMQGTIRAPEIKVAEPNRKDEEAVTKEDMINILAKVLGTRWGVEVEELKPLQVPYEKRENDAETIAKALEVEAQLEMDGAQRIFLLDLISYLGIKRSKDVKNSATDISLFKKYQEQIVKRIGKDVKKWPSMSNVPHLQAWRIVKHYNEWLSEKAEQPYSLPDNIDIAGIQVWVKAYKDFQSQSGHPMIADMIKSGKVPHYDSAFIKTMDTLLKAVLNWEEKSQSRSTPEEAIAS